jgi:hypothetical protein
MGRSSGGLIIPPSHISPNRFKATALKSDKSTFGPGGCVVA